MSEPLATVIIPNYNGRRFLPALLASLAGQSEPRFVIVVVDDASPDDSVSYLRESHPEVQLIVNGRNRGFAASCNAGIAVARTPFVVLLNNDTHVDGNWMAEGLRPLEDASIGSVASLTLLAGEPDRVDTAGDVYSIAGGAQKRCHLALRREAELLPQEAFSPSGVSAFYRREAVISAGCLDEAFESYYEDVDLGFRLARMGYRCAFAPGSICYHHLSSSYKPTGWRYHFNSARNAEVVWWANLPWVLLWRSIPAHLAFLAMQCGHKISQGVGFAYVCGKLAAIGRIGQIVAKRKHLAAISRIGPAELRARLVLDWWGAHVTSRRRGSGG